MPRLAIIGGSGFYDVKGLKLRDKKAVETKFGDVSVFFYTDDLGREIVFLPRHGPDHRYPPHKVNYRGNIFALKILGVQRIIGVTAVGSLRKEIAPGDLVLQDQFIDFTKSRTFTFFDGDGYVIHTDFTAPYCTEIRKSILAAPLKGLKLHEKGTYVCTEGPRFETPAEIRMFAAMGGDVVGMTGVPECVLARELGMGYAGISVVTNYAAGIGDSPLTQDEVVDVMKRMEAPLHSLIIDALFRLPEKSECSCEGVPCTVR